MKNAIIFMALAVLLGFTVTSCREDRGDTIVTRQPADGRPSAQDLEYLSNRSERISGPLRAYLGEEWRVVAAGVAAESEGRYDEALATYRDARDMLQRLDVPGEPKRYVPQVVNLDIGRAALKTGRYLEADQALNRFLAITFSDALATFYEMRDAQAAVDQDQPGALELLPRAQRQLAADYASWSRHNVLESIDGTEEWQPRRVELVSPTQGKLTEAGAKYLAVYWNDLTSPDLVTFVTARALTPPLEDRTGDKRLVWREGPKDLMIIFTHNSGDLHSYKITRDYAALTSTGN